MTTTSLKLPEDLKQRAETAARELGISTHAFMVSAIRQAADAVEQRAKFVVDAQNAHAEMLENGVGFDADDVRAYLRKRLDDRTAERPKRKQWRE